MNQEREDGPQPIDYALAAMVVLLIAYILTQIHDTNKAFTPSDNVRPADRDVDITVDPLNTGEQP